MSPLRIALGWGVDSETGWGLVGLHLALGLAKHPDVELTLPFGDLRGLNALDLAILQPAVLRGQVLMGLLSATREAIPFDGVVVYALGNHFREPDLKTRMAGARHLGLMVFEDTAFSAGDIDRGRSYDWLVTASSWNRNVLASHGLVSTYIQQPIDPTIFHPAPRSGRWADRFVVFSGGKLEYRKGQDIVLAAFKQFHAKHPDALLVTAWQNKWPGLAIDMTLGGHVDHEPERFADCVDIQGWFEDNGLPEGSAIDVGFLPNARMAQVMREADVGIFASRAEGGTNLMAMECMACGIPTASSANTGHLDLNPVLIEQCPVKQPSAVFDAVEGWGETDPRDIADCLTDWHGIRGRLRRWSPLSFPTPAEYAERLVEVIRG